MGKNNYGFIGKHKTNIYNQDGYTCVQYHNTKVVRFNDTEIILNHGGYLSNTTKLRMNQTSNQFHLDYFVYQKNYEWFVEFGGRVYEFENGMSLPRLDYIRKLGNFKPDTPPGIILDWWEEHER